MEYLKEILCDELPSWKISESESALGADKLFDLPTHAI